MRCLFINLHTHVPVLHVSLVPTFVLCKAQPMFMRAAHYAGRALMAAAAIDVALRREITNREVQTVEQAITEAWPLGALRSPGGVA